MMEDMGQHKTWVIVHRGKTFYIPLLFSFPHAGFLCKTTSCLTSHDFYISKNVCNQMTWVSSIKLQSLLEKSLFVFFFDGNVNTLLTIWLLFLLSALFYILNRTSAFLEPTFFKEKVNRFLSFGGWAKKRLITYM